MESCKGYKPTSDVKHSSTDDKPMSISDTELIAMDLQQSDVHVCLEQQPSEKLSKTTLQFFRVRKGFFILPALFGGSKRQKKVSLKKGIGKSKTHDGLCKTIDDDNLKSNESYKCKHQKDLVENIPRSQCEFAQNTKDQKSRSLPRPKRSWRGFFNSIRRHKKNQNVEYENKKIIAMSCPHDYNPEILNAQAISDQSDTQCLKEFCKPNVPDLAKATCVNLAPLCNNADVIVFESNMVKQRSLTIETGEMVRNNNDPVRFIESPAANRDVCSRLKNPTDDSTLTIGRSDQINLIYGDVESLKSFDSLTGCGDIIADQDDDSIAESNVSGERSRSAIKRSSCHVTYQGGGEEMATPVEVDGNCLRNFWGNEVPEQITFTCNQSQGLLEQSIALMAIEETSTFNDIVHTNDGINAIKIPDTITYGQESALNRDEGYYNSTTPGSDEGKHAQLDRIMPDILAPRDNCCGDALYDCRGANDIISPPFENPLKRPHSVPHEILKASADINRHVFSNGMGLLQREKAKLYRIQEYFLSSKGMHEQLKGQPDEILHASTQLNTDEKASIKQVTPLSLNQIGNTAQGLHAQKENSSKLYSAASCEKRLSNPAHVTSDLDASEKCCGSKEPYQKEIKPVPKPYIRVDSKVTSDSDEDQTISFSQALVDFTKHSNLFSSSTHYTTGSEMSAPFSQNMDALPAIVTFDVVNMHNEGQYDQQMDDYIASPYQVFDENRMLDLNQNSFFSNIRAIASLPRNISLTRTNQSMTSPLALNRKSRSLDTESLDFGMPGMYLGNRSVLGKCPQTEIDSQVSLLHCEKNGPTSKIRDTREEICSNMSTFWQQETERPFSVTIIDRKITGKDTQPCPSKVKSAVYSDLSHGKVLTPLPANTMSESICCNVFSENTLALKKNCNLSLVSDVCLPETPFVISRIPCDDLLVRSDSGIDGGGEGLFYRPKIASQFCSQHSKNRPVGITQGMPHFGSPINSCFPKSEIHFNSNVRKAIDRVYPVLFNEFSTGENPN